MGQDGLYMTTMPPSHMAMAGQQILAGKQTAHMPQPTYSSQLIPCDFDSFLD